MWSDHVLEEESGKLVATASRADRDAWDLWASISLKELSRPPTALLTVFPVVIDDGHGSDVRWLFEQLRANEAIRINSGGEDYKSSEGVLWGRDRFFLGGKPARTFRGEVKGTEDDVLYQSERWFPADEIGPAGYRIPVPPGRYRVTLHFAEVWFGAQGLRKFDVVIDGKKLLEDYEPFLAGFGTPDRRVFEVESEDGLLDIEFIHRVENPTVSAIEIKRLD